MPHLAKVPSEQGLNPGWPFLIPDKNEHKAVPDAGAPVSLTAAVSLASV